MSRRKVITAETIRQAGRIIDRALDASDADVRSPGLDQLAVARREQDPVARSQKTTAALKEGSRDLQAARDRLNKLKRQQDAPADMELTPEAERELESLKEHILARIRRRAEEEMARNYPEQPGGKRRRPPQRRLNV